MPVHAPSKLRGGHATESSPAGAATPVSSPPPPPPPTHPTLAPPTCALISMRPVGLKRMGWLPPWCPNASLKVLAPKAWPSTCTMGMNRNRNRTTGVGLRLATIQGKAGVIRRPAAAAAGRGGRGATAAATMHASHAAGCRLHAAPPPPTHTHLVSHAYAKHGLLPQDLLRVLNSIGHSGGVTLRAGSRAGNHSSAVS